jgi:hypothetical protein
MALLRRYESEAAREEARELAEALATEAARAAVLQLRYVPHVLEAGQALDAA